jgi:hypothetical protein
MSGEENLMSRISKKEKLLTKLEQTWSAFTESYAGLTDEQLLAPGVTEDWSVKDILAHVSWWEAESLKHLPEILQGIQPPRYSVTYGGIDAFNAQMTELKRAVPLAEVRRDLEETHAKLIAYLHSVDEAQFAASTRFMRRLGWDTYKHYPLHTRAILEWRQRTG